MQEFDKDAQKRIMDKLMEQEGQNITQVIARLLNERLNSAPLLGLIQAKEFKMIEAHLGRDKHE